MRFKTMILFLIFTIVGTTMDAQRTRSRKTRETVKEEETVKLMDKLNFEIRVGNVGINQGFSLSAKPGVGYKVADFFTAGLGARMFYNFYNFYQAPDISTFDYGAFAFGRFKIAQVFYIQGEYGYTHFNTIDFVGTNYNIAYPSAGIGYLSGEGKWKYGLELMFPINEDARDNGVSLEYWLNFSYNF